MESSRISVCGGQLKQHINPTACTYEAVWVPTNALVGITVWKTKSRGSLFPYSIFFPQNSSTFHPTCSNNPGSITHHANHFCWRLSHTIFKYIFNTSLANTIPTLLQCQQSQQCYSIWTSRYAPTSLLIQFQDSHNQIADAIYEWNF